MKNNTFKAIILLALFAITGYNSFSQCTPNTSVVSLGVFPDTLPTGCVGEEFTESFTFVFRADTVVFTSTFSFDSIAIKGYVNLPTGVTAQCGTSNCTMYHTPSYIYGCITLSGTRLAQSINDSIEILFTEYFNVYGSPDSLNESRYIRFTMFANNDTSVVNVANTLAAAQQGVAYRWLDCGNGFSEISGENGSTFTPTATGSYAVELSNGNCTDTSGCHLVVVGSIFENGYGIKTYPNPASDVLSIELPMSMSNLSVKIYNMLGIQVLVENFDETKSIELPLDLNSGIYFIELLSENQLIYRDRISVN